MGLLLIGLYLIGVGYQGQAGNLLSLLSQEGAFLPWAISVGILAWIWRVVPPPGREPVHVIIGGAVLGIILIEASKIISGTEAAWEALTGLSTSGVTTPLTGTSTLAPIGSSSTQTSSASNGSLLPLIANIESGNNPNAPGGGLYQETAGFTQTYGAGATGVTNYAQLALSANPNLTVGDFYAEYNGGTGNPGFGQTFSQMQVNNPAGYNNALNKMNAAGISPSTPLSSLL
jgi:hypothetical protein